MKIKKIILNNIRSYQSQEITFPTGSILLSGDIGSGKTSILLGIEFALFGLQPGQKGSSLLRNGCDEGSVILEFEVDEKEIVIERSLKRRKTINQDYCSIIIDGVKSEISVTELKSKILEILNYPIEFSKKQNILYRFTVYTPQEQMKEIILEDPEIRINTLRNVFGIDKYKRILDNTFVLITKIREEKRMKEGIVSNLERDKQELNSKITEIEIKRESLKINEKALKLKIEQRKKIEEEKNELLKKKEEKQKLNQEIEKYRLMILTKEDIINSSVKTINQLKSEIEELQKLNFDESRLSNLEREITSLKSSKNELNEKNIKISSEISALVLKNKDNELAKNKISKIEMCPTCLQDVGEVHKKNVVNNFESNIVENSKTIELLSLEKRELLKKFSELDNSITNKEKELRDLYILRIKLQGIQEKEKRLKDLEKNTDSLKKDILFLNQQISILKNSLLELSNFDSLFESKENEFKLSLKDERMAEIRVAELRTETEVFADNINELSKKIKKTELEMDKLNYLATLENWLSEEFIPFIELIEKNVMAHLKSQFSQLFSEWFNMLVPENFNVRLDDNFTPIIEQQDYELDYSYMSGGERTAVALAYRLSLNQIINSLLSKIKTKDIVILDEPTDGFSDQQLDKMRGVLDELNVAQLIIVSHEQKIEGFVQNIVHFKKEGGVSVKD